MKERIHHIKSTWTLILTAELKHIYTHDLHTCLQLDF